MTSVLAGQHAVPPTGRRKPATERPPRRPEDPVQEASYTLGILAKKIPDHGQDGHDTNEERRSWLKRTITGLTDKKLDDLIALRRNSDWSAPEIYQALADLMTAQ